jgi:hypothetical protein
LTASRRSSSAAASSNSPWLASQGRVLELVALRQRQLHFAVGDGLARERQARGFAEVVAFVAIALDRTQGLGGLGMAAAQRKHRQVVLGRRIGGAALLRLRGQLQALVDAGVDLPVRIVQAADVLHVAGRQHGQHFPGQGRLGQAPLLGQRDRAFALLLLERQIRRGHRRGGQRGQRLAGAIAGHGCRWARAAAERRRSGQCCGDAIKETPGRARVSLALRCGGGHGPPGNSQPSPSAHATALPDGQRFMARQWPGWFAV